MKGNQMKRYLLTIIMMLLNLMLLTACTINYEHVGEAIRPEIKENANDERSSDIGLKSIIEESEDQTISVHYPITDYDKIDAILSEFALNRIELFRQETASIKLSNDENWPYELHIDFEIVYETSRHLSLVLKENKYLGGPQSVSTIYTFNFNLESGRQLALKDLFKGSSAYLEILSQYVSDTLLNGNTLDVALDEDWVIKGSTPLESNFKHFLIVENGIIVLFEKYQIGPAFIGEPSLEIPFEVFKAHIELKEITLPSPPVETTESSAEETTLVNSDLQVTHPDDNTSSVSNRKKIALTFEDGPHPIYTPIILDTLNSREDVATFFVLGNRAQEYPELVKRIYEEGHLIGNHTWSHPQLPRLGNETLITQLEKTRKTIFDITGFSPFIYRPPYGIYTENVISIGDMPAILWSIDPLDLKYEDSDYITNYVLDHAFDGAIVVLRDTNPNTTQALSAIIDGLTRAGFELVTVDELLKLNPENAAKNVRIFSRGSEKK